MDSKQTVEYQDFEPEIGNITEEQNKIYQKKAEQLHEILEGDKSKLQNKNREEPLIKFVLSQTKKERQIIRKFYKTLYKTDIYEPVKKDFSFNFKRTILGLFYTLPEFDAITLFKAMDGLLTDIETVIEVICSRNNTQLNEIKQIFRNTNKKNMSLEEMIKKETKGELQKLFLDILKCERSENLVPDEELMKNLSEKLYKLGEGKWSNDAQFFKRVFILSSKQELYAINELYMKKTGHTLKQGIKKEFSGDLRKAYTTIIEGMLNPSEYFASNVKEAIKGLGTNDKLLIRTLVCREEIDIPRIRSSYKTFYNSNMVKDIEEDTSGDYQKLIVAIAGTNKMDPYEIDIKLIYAIVPSNYVIYKTSFQMIDADHKGTIKKSEILPLLNKIGYKYVTQDDIDDYLSKNNIQGDSIYFEDFIKMMSEFELLEGQRKAQKKLEEEEERKKEEERLKKEEEERKKREEEEEKKRQEELRKLEEQKKLEELERKQKEIEELKRQKEEEELRRQKEIEELRRQKEEEEKEREKLEIKLRAKPKILEVPKEPEPEPEIPIDENERTAYVKLMNKVLEDDEVCKNYLPINPNTNEVFLKMNDGVLLCKLINKAQPGTIDERVINVKDLKDDDKMSKIENLNLGISAAKSIGCSVNDINNEDFLKGKKDKIMIILGEVSKQIIFKDINLKNFPQLVRLKKPGEENSDLLKLSQDDLLLRWFNYHLKNAGCDKEITNFNDDIKDGEKYTLLLNHLDPSKCDKSALNEGDQTKRAEMVIDNAKKLDVDCYIEPNDITSGNEKLNKLFVAQIFNKCPGLEATENEKIEAAKLIEDDTEGSREERSFRMWINSLDLEGIKLNNLYEDSKTGILLLKMEDKVTKGCVDWKKVDMKCSNVFKVGVNCQEVVDAAKKSGYSVVGIGSQDIREGNKKYILAIVWQIMRKHTLQVIGDKTEEELVNWANGRVPDEYKIKNLKDKSLKNSLYFIEVMKTIEPRVINWDIVVKDKDDDESRENNAKYAISIARKLGATVFMTWEDITEIKEKMLLTFLASIYDVAINYETV